MAFSFQAQISEHPLYPGYYLIPIENTDSIVNKEGRFINPETGAEKSQWIQKKGYSVVCLRDGRQYRNFSVHRILALLFVPKPVKHLDKDFAELQVNHIDGDKANNELKNLEWVTGKENMEHARELGLFHNEKTVLARSLESGEIVRYKSLSECARLIAMTPSSVSVHLNSVCAGMIEQDGWVFKFDDGRDWPDLLSYDRTKTTLRHVADVIAENVETGDKILCNSLVHAFEATKLSKNIVKNHRVRRGCDVPYEGWVFYPLSSNN